MKCDIGDSAISTRLYFETVLKSVKTELIYKSGLAILYRAVVSQRHLQLSFVVNEVALIFLLLNGFLVALYGDELVEFGVTPWQDLEIYLKQLNDMRWLA